MTLFAWIRFSVGESPASAYTAECVANVKALASSREEIDSRFMVQHSLINSVCKVPSPLLVDEELVKLDNLEIGSVYRS